jgi:hypothetical protein
VIGQLLEDLTVLEEVLEDPAACRLEHGDSLMTESTSKVLGCRKKTF